MKDRIEHIINEELNKYEFELPKDEYSVIASELAEKLVKLFCQPAVIKSVCGNLHHFTDIAHLGRCEECLETRKT